MANMDFEKTFHSDNSKRDKYLSRQFGIFSEKVIVKWCKNAKSEYTNLGRPTLKGQNGTLRSTLDYTLRSDDGKNYVAEQKCELEYQNYKYLSLIHPSQLDHHNSMAFQRFLELSRDTSSFETFVGGKLHKIDGTILFWGKVTPEGRESVMEATNIQKIISIEECIQDLIKWKDPEYLLLIEEYRTWSNELFNFLVGSGR